ncbi:MAG: M3 family metallopeptidase, partial [Synechococcus sp. ELA057]
MTAATTLASLPTAPLLQGEGLPRFEAITPEQVSSRIPELLERLEAEFAALEGELEQAEIQGRPLGWADLMDPLHRIEERLRWSWGVVSHLHAVCNSPELREAYAAQQARVVAFGNRTGQSAVLHRALSRLQQDPGLDASQRRILQIERRHMELRGVGLSGAEQEAFNATSQELAELSTRFGNRVLDATNAWTLLLRHPDELEGLPASLLELLAQAARDRGATPAEAEASAETGPWLLGLDYPRSGPFLQYSHRRDLREILYKAQVSRASGQDADSSGQGVEAEDSNWPVIERILSLRRQQAQRLGYASWASQSLASKMAADEAEVERLLEDLRAAAYPAAQRELDDLRAIAARHGAPEAGDLQPWDVSFWAEKLRQERFDLDSEALRPWFPLPRVLEGLFALCDRLFAIRIEAADGEAPVWQADVRFFRVLDRASGEPLAAFYLDPYSRPGSKRGGAWMDECLVRSRRPDGVLTLPVAYLICNQSPPVGDTPSLMTFQEVETLFHEFGHGLQHMLTTVERPQAAGINGVEWDAVELPSQFMENWCYDRATLLG